MATEAILAYLSKCSLEAGLEFRVAVQCAPVLAGIKISNLITVPAGSWKPVKQALRGSQIGCVVLFTKEGRETLLLYRRQQEEEYLGSPEVRRFLRHFGYERFDLASVIIRLRARCNRHALRRCAVFPHELGVVLGYPVRDAEGFIKNHGKHFLISGYWKVYGDVKKARETFAQYDRARENAMRAVMAGESLSRIAENLHEIIIK